jgi:hypothetical protein
VPTIFPRCAVRATPRGSGHHLNDNTRAPEIGLLHCVTEIPRRAIGKKEARSVNQASSKGRSPSSAMATNAGGDPNCAMTESFHHSTGFRPDNFVAITAYRVAVHFRHWERPTRIAAMAGKELLRGSLGTEPRGKLLSVRLENRTKRGTGGCQMINRLRRAKGPARSADRFLLHPERGTAQRKKTRPRCLSGPRR